MLSIAVNGIKNPLAGQIRLMNFHGCDPIGNQENSLGTVKFFYVLVGGDEFISSILSMFAS